MKNNKRNSALRLKIGIALVFIFIWAVVGFFKYLNEPAIQNKIFTNINKISSLKIKSGHFNLNLISRKITFKDLNLFNAKRNQAYKLTNATIKFSIFPLLKGSLNIRELALGNITINAKNAISTISEKRKRLNITKFLLLKNLTISNGNIKNIEVLTKNGNYKLNDITIKFIPSFLGKVRLNIGIEKSISELPNGDIIRAENISIAGATDINKWLNDFPYVDDLAGEMGAIKIYWHDFNINDLDIQLYYSDKNLKLHHLKSLVNGHRIEIDGKANGNNQKYAMSINMPDPIALPALGKATSFIDTSGSIAGKIDIEGEGLDYKTTKAIATVSLKHFLKGADSLPAEVDGKIDINKGKINLNNITIKAANNLVLAKGYFDYVNPHIDLEFSGKNIPVESVLNRFRNKHYKPTFGLADVTGHVKGWKGDLDFTLNATASAAGYYEMLSERAKLELSMTYNHLDLNGYIYQKQQEVAVVNLKMDMGDLLSDGSRYKNFDLSVALRNADLSNIMIKYGITGTASGTLHLSGTPTNYTGSGKAIIENGNVKNLDFTYLSADIQFMPKQITFSNINLATNEATPYSFINPLYMDITETGIHIHGNPRLNLDIDATYSTGSGAWEIDKLAYASLKKPEWETILNGSITKDGVLNLTANGIIDTELLSNIRGFIREARGPATLQNVHITGVSTNPAITGTIKLENNSLQLRTLGYYIDKLYGEITLNGHDISIPSITGRIEYGDFKLLGKLSHQNMEISNTDLNFTGTSIMYATPDKAFKMEFDCDLSIKGNARASSLMGNINILDGRYSKRFSILEQLKKQTTLDEEDITAKDLWNNMKLDLKIKTYGDLTIDNNIGEIWLTADLKIRGTRKNPQITGIVETAGGDIHYAGLKFDVTTGFIDFRGPFAKPYVELNGTREVGTYNVTITLRGATDKLRLELNSTPALDRKNILALLAFGITDDELQSERFGLHFGTGLVAEQVASIFQGPITQITSLDEFRVESGAVGGEDTTRVYMGKDISDRLRVSFITSLKSVDATQIFQTEYLITDFLLLKGSGSTSSDYTFNFTFRFREQ